MTTDETRISQATGKICTEHFYYYENRKRDLGTVSTESIIIGFVPGLEATQKENFIASHATYIKGKESYDTYEYTSPEIMELQPDLTCGQVEELLALLQQSNLVRYANPTFMIPDGFRGIGGHFIVTLKEKSTLAQLEALAAKTKTRVTEELSSEMKIYLLEADKHSNGNSLEMANYFHKQPIVQQGEPDFVLQSPGIGTW